MGISEHEINFLLYARKKQPAFGPTATIGRQRVYLDPARVPEIVGTGPGYVHHAYCEELLKNYFGASQVDAVDNSSYEGAPVIWDMNKEVPPHLHGTYHTIYDGGCLEHIYNIPQALKNCSLLCSPGGQIIHVLPANNQCGHGFWQISPELFFSLYSDKNGYQDTEVFMVEISNPRTWFKVKRPQNGERALVWSDMPAFVLARTVRKGKEFSHENVQQSDYQHAWEHAESKPVEGTPVQARQGLAGAMKKLLKRCCPVLHVAYRRHLNMKFYSSWRLDGSNPCLTTVDVASVL